MTRRIALALAAALLVPAAGAAQQPPPGAEPSFAAHLVPPELVMQHQRRLGLTEQQRATITGAVKELQGKAVDLQWRLQEDQQRLAELLAGPSVDAAAALAQVERLLDVERQIKMAHLTMLIRIKNTLTPEQQAILRTLRSGDERGRPERPREPTP